MSIGHPVSNCDNNKNVKKSSKSTEEESEQKTRNQEEENLALVNQQSEKLPGSLKSEEFSHSGEQRTNECRTLSNSDSQENRERTGVRKFGRIFTG